MPRSSGIYFRVVHGELEKYGSKKEKEQYSSLPEISDMIKDIHVKKEFARKIVRNFVNGKYDGILGKLKGSK